MGGSVVSVNVSVRKGEAKRPVDAAVLREDHGIEGDCHAGPGEKQVSLLAWESVEEQLELMREKGVRCPKAEELVDERGNGSAADASAAAQAGDDLYELRPGDYAENLTVRGVDLRAVGPGDRIEAGSALLEVTRIGKECHKHCAVYARLGDCVMPREGVFTRVLRGGQVRAGDAVAVSRGGG
jgi:MOSC domain-containing protein YiiM